MKMLISIAKIKPNPFRDFELYPIDEPQVERLRRSIHDLGFFSSVTLRRDGAGGYEMAAGHHRIEAARREGLTEIEAVVADLDTDRMIRVMVSENILQRGYNAGAVLDSVAAAARFITEAVLEPRMAQIFLHQLGFDTDASLSQAKRNVLDGGPGEQSIYHYINGMAYAGRQRSEESLPIGDIRTALASLKKSGRMVEMVTTVYDRIKAEEDAKAKAEEEARLRREAEQEAERLAIEEAAAAAKAKAEREADEAELKAKEAEAKKSADAAKTRAKATAAEARRKEVAEAEKKQRARAEAAKKERERDKALRLKASADYANKRAMEEERLKAQAELEAVYDIRCDSVFRLASHVNAFREVVTSDNGRRFIPKNQQFPLAQQIRAEVDDEEQRQGRDSGSTSIRDKVMLVVMEAQSEQRNIDAQEKADLLKASAIERVKMRWKSVISGMQIAEGSLGHLAEERKAWEAGYPRDPFPVDMASMTKLRGMAQRLDRLFNLILGPIE